jgi:hypothetical protein
MIANVAPGGSMHPSPIAWSNPQWYRWVPVLGFLDMPQDADGIGETGNCRSCLCPSHRTRMENRLIGES